MPKCFAYGTNCDPEVLDRKGVAVATSRRAVLRGFRLLFNKKSLRERLPGAIGYANINECRDGVVEGALYELDEAALTSLDESERYPSHYTRIRVVVEVDGGCEGCWAYQAQPDKMADGLVPSRDYLDHILAGRAFLSAPYLEALERSRTYACECACCHRTDEVLFVDEHDRLHALCQPCREAHLDWSDVLGRMLTISETESVMTELGANRPRFASSADLVDEAVARNLIQR